MQSSNESTLRQVVENRLRESLPAADLTTESFDQKTLLVMKAEPTLAGFSFGETKEDFRLAYDAFKALYAARRSHWSGFDVSFAFCYLPNSIADDSFVSSVETDVFFCRKFALEISEEDTSALSRLPFLPLVPVAEGGARPPSAQTLLQNSGVSPDLARALVVAGNRSAQRIVDDHLDAPIDELDSSQAPDDIRLIEQSAEDQISLHSITMTNFRAYKGPTTFEFGEGVTVLYGPNGFGKTSLFDALDFVATGGIGRLKLEHNSPALQKSAKHLDSGDDPSGVEIKFKRGEKFHTLLRTLDKPSVATLDGRENVGRKEALTLLTGSEDSPIADRIDNLVSLFRATHSYNQESSELTQGFSQSCQLSADLVSRMLAFDDYVRAIKKVDEVIRNLDQRSRSASNQLSDSSERLRLLNTEIHRVEGLTSVQIDSEQLTNELVKLAQEVMGISGQSMGSGIIVDADPRSIRSDVDGLLKTLELRVQRLNEAATLVGRHGAVRGEEALASARLQAIQQAHSDLSKMKDLAERSYSEIFSTAQADLATSARLQSRQENLKKLAARSSSRAMEVTILQDLEERVGETQVQLEVVRTRMKEHSSQEEKNRSDEADIAKTLVVLRSRLADLEGLKASLSASVIFKRRASDLADAETALSEEYRQVEEALERNSELLELARHEEAAASSAMAVIERERSEISGLLVALREHIRDENCLLCGVKHESKEVLIGRVDATLEDDSGMKMAAQLLSTRRNAVAELLKESDTWRARQSALHARILANQADVRFNDSQLTEIRGRFSDAGVGDTEAEIASKEADISARLKSELLKHAKAASDGQQLLVNGGELEAELRARSSEWNALSTDLALARAADRDFKALIEITGVPATSTQAHIDQHVAEGNSLCSAASQASAHSGALLNERKSELEEINRQISDSNTSIQKAASYVSTLKAQSDSLAAQIMSAGLSTDSGPDEAQQAIQVALAEMVSLQQIRDRVVSLEHAKETLATSAVLESLLRERNQAADHITTLTRDIEKSEASRKYFAELARMLESRRNQATREFTEQYGPRTAIIQRRLRPVYGFGDISVSSRNGAISVEVMRNGEPHRPTDYFSQSQVQTLILGLFLTAAGSQSWSSCASILMDDPVSHFDDLNTYALVDLVSGLANSAADSRQFIISTCDEKLMQIARHKFQHLGERARIYRFKSIGQNGPEIGEVGDRGSAKRLNS